MGKSDESNDHLRQLTANFRVPFMAPSEIYPSVWKHIIEAARNSEQEMVERFKQVASFHAKFEEPCKEQWNRTSQGVAEAVKRTLLRVKLLGELGWTMPMEMSWPEFQALAMEDDLTVERVNEWFVTYYTEDNASGFKRLAGGLLSSRQLAFWKPLVEQCVRAFEKGDFALCVPSLLLILEGSIAKLLGVTFENPKTRRVFFERKISAAASGSIKEYKWRSVQVFTDS